MIAASILQTALDVLRATVGCVLLFEAAWWICSRSRRWPAAWPKPTIFGPLRVPSRSPRAPRGDMSDWEHDLAFVAFIQGWRRGHAGEPKGDWTPEIARESLKITGRWN